MSEAADIREKLVREVRSREGAIAQLEQRVHALRAEKDAAQESCLRGVEAAQMQMKRMRAELKALNAAPRKEVQADESTHVMDEDEERSLKQMKQLESRALRHELSKWRHQASLLESERPGQEAEVARLKAELTNAEDVLESTRHAVRHLEVERLGQQDGMPGAKRDATLQLDKNGLPVGSAKGGKGNVEAHCERKVREAAEDRGHILSSKSKRLGQVILAQQMLIQRLEKQIMKEEGLLEQREMRLAGEQKLHLRLKVALRQRSDEIVVEKILGKLGTQKIKSKDETQLEE